MMDSTFMMYLVSICGCFVLLELYELKKNVNEQSDSRIIQGLCQSVTAYGLQLTAYGENAFAVSR